MQRQGGRGLRKLGGTGWPSHQTDRGGRARAQAGRWQTRAEPAQPQRDGTEPAAVSQEIQLSVAEEGIREVCCARCAVLPKSFCIFSLMRYRSPICCSTPLTKPKQVGHWADLPQQYSSRSISPKPRCMFLIHESRPEGVSLSDLELVWISVDKRDNLQCTQRIFVLSCLSTCPCWHGEAQGQSPCAPYCRGATTRPCACAHQACLSRRCEQDAEWKISRPGSS